MTDDRSKAPTAAAVILVTFSIYLTPMKNDTYITQCYAILRAHGPPYVYELYGSHIVAIS